MSLTSVPAVLSLESNVEGRDIAVGDIHGYFSVLEEALDTIGFDEKVDRLFCVGDLVDRGPESILAKEYLKAPWFYSVAGNHDLHFTQALYRGNPAFAIAGDCTHWLFEYDDNIQEDLIKELDMLPAAIELNTPDGIVVLVHAEIEGSFWGDFKERLEEGCEHAWTTATWGRGVIRQGLSENRLPDVHDVRAIVHGHTPVDRYRKLGNRHYIDTGLFIYPRKGVGSLTLIDLNKLEVILKDYVGELKYSKSP